MLSCTNFKWVQTQVFMLTTKVQLSHLSNSKYWFKKKKTNKTLIVSKTKHICIHNNIYRDKAQKPKSHGYIKSEVLISKYCKQYLSTILSEKKTRLSWMVPNTVRLNNVWLVIVLSQNAQNLQVPSLSSFSITPEAALDNARTQAAQPLSFLYGPISLDTKVKGNRSDWWVLDLPDTLLLQIYLTKYN